MPNAASLVVKINADIKDAERGFNQVESRVQGLGGKLGTVLGTAGGFVLGTAINSLIGGFGELAQSGLDFGAQMANVNSILKLSDDGIAQLSNEVLALARNPGIVDTPAALAAGLYQINSSGFTGAEGLKVLEASALAATAGLTSTDVAARAVSAVLNAYQLDAGDAQHISDLLFQTVNDGVISFEELANNLGNTIPLANSLGVSLEDLFAAYSLLTLQGFSGTAAETNIAALMKTAMNPTEALTAAITQQGYATAQQAIETLGFGGYIGLMEDYAESAGLTLFDLIGTQEGVNAALAIGGDNAGAYADEVDKMNHASDGAGATAAALEKQMKSASFQLAKAKQQAMVLATTIMQWLSPSIAGLAAGAASGIGQFTDWLTGAFQLTFDFEKRLGKSNIEAFFSTLGITLENITGLNLDRWFTRMGKAMQRPIDAARKMFDALGRRRWDLLVAGIGDAISSIPKFVGDALKGVETGFEPLDKILHTTGKLFTDFGRLIQELGQGDFAGFMTVLDRTGDHLLDLGDQLLDVGVSAGRQAIDFVLDIVPKIGDWLWDTGSDLISWAIGHLPGSTEGDGTGGPEPGTQSTVSVVLNAVASFGEWIFDIGSDFISWALGHLPGSTEGDLTGGPEPGTPTTKDIFFDLIAQLGQWIFDEGTDFVSWAAAKARTASRAIASAAPAVVDIAMRIGAGAIGAGASLAGWVGSHIGTVIGWMRLGWDGAMTIGGIVIDAIIDGAEGIKGWIESNSSMVIGWIRSGWDGTLAIGSMTIDAIIDGATELKGWISANTTTVQGWIESGWDGTISGISASLSFVASYVSTTWGEYGDDVANAGEWLKGQIGDITTSGLVTLISGIDPQWSPGADISFSDAVDALVKQATSDKTYELPVNIYIGIGDISYDAGEFVNAIFGKLAEIPALLALGPVGMLIALEGWAVKTFGPAMLRSIATGTINFFKGAVGIDENTDISSVISEWLGGVIESIQHAIQTGLSVLDNPFSAIGDTISGWWDAIFSGSDIFGANGSADPAAGYVAGGNLSLFDGLMTTISTAWETFKNDVLGMDWALPSIPFKTGLIGDSVGTIVTFIDDRVADLKAAWEKLKFWENGGDSGVTPRTSDNARFTTSADSNPSNQPGTLANGEIVTTLPDVGSGPGGTVFTATFDIDYTAVDQASQVAFTLGHAWADQTFESTFGAEYQLVDQASQVAWLLGGAWADSMHESTFTADYTQVGSAYSTAFLMGNTWDSQVFTASFAIDTSGLINAVAVARQAAADIAAVMPHSPADEGPLKEPITFDYIADNMRATADRLGEYAQLGASRVGGAFGDRFGMGYSAGDIGSVPHRFGDTYNIKQIFVTPDSEQFQDIARKARTGGDFAVEYAALKQQGV